MRTIERITYGKAFIEPDEECSYMHIQFFGAAGEVTGSCHLVSVGSKRILLDCGMVQGGHRDEARNREAFPFDASRIDAVILSHAHIDHSGRLPLLLKSGYRGAIYTHRATADLCHTMLRDTASLAERDAKWENRKRARKGLDPIAPLFTIEDANRTLEHFKGLDYGDKQDILPGISLRLADAGHILGSAIIELWLDDGSNKKKLVYSGDLGRSGMPILEDPTPIREADLVIMESTYGDRLHRNWDDTLDELHTIFTDALSQARGNILIPAFAVGRTQEILFLMAKHYRQWDLDRWHIFVDSPMAIEASEAYIRNAEIFDRESAQLWQQHLRQSQLPNLHFSRTPEESMRINQIHAGAIIIAGSGMCTGGRIKHHLKHNVWRSECHVIITGYQAHGTLGRSLVDGAQRIRLWGESIRVASPVHTIGGLSAHADQQALCDWYGNFDKRPPLVLVHGETVAIENLTKRLGEEYSAPVRAAQTGQSLNLLEL